MAEKNGIVEVLMNRDGMTRKEAQERLDEVREWFDPSSDDPDEVLMEEFGLEPDYIFDLLW